MKAAAIRHNRYTPRPKAIPYPNAANRRYFLEKALDHMLAAAVCLGLVTIVLFLFTLA